MKFELEKAPDLVGLDGWMILQGQRLVKILSFHHFFCRSALLSWNSFFSTFSNFDSFIITEISFKKVNFGCILNTREDAKIQERHIGRVRGAQQSPRRSIRTASKNKEKSDIYYFWVWWLGSGSCLGLSDHL